MANSKFIYVVSLILLLSISILLIAGAGFGGIFLFFVPGGFRGFAFALILFVLLTGIFITSNRQQEIKTHVLQQVVTWIPFIIYIFIRAEFSPVGLFKFLSFVMKIFFPCMAVIVLYSSGCSIRLIS